MKLLSKLDAFHKTRVGYGVFGVIELGLACLFANTAVSSGNVWEWILAVVFLVGSLQDFVRLIGKLAHGNRSKTS